MFGICLLVFFPLYLFSLVGCSPHRFPDPCFISSPPAHINSELKPRPPPYPSLLCCRSSVVFIHSAVKNILRFFPSVLELWKILDRGVCAPALFNLLLSHFFSSFHNPSALAPFVLPCKCNFPWSEKLYPLVSKCFT